MKRLTTLLLGALCGAFFVSGPVLSQTTDRLDGIQTSVAVKPPVKAASTANLTLSGLQTVGGVELVAGDRVLVKDQTDATQNGIYVVDTSAWQRAADFDGNRDVRQGTLVVVNRSTGQDYFYQVDTADPIVIGTSSITFTLTNDPNVSYDILDSEVSAGFTAGVLSLAYAPGDIRRYGLNGDGSTNDATNLNKIFTAAEDNFHVKFPDEPLTYAITSVLTIPEGIDVDFNGSTIRRTTTDATDTFQISVGVDAKIRNLIFDLPSGVQIEQGITLTDGSHAYNVQITSTDQQNNLGSSEKVCFNVDGDSTIVKRLTVANCDRAIRFEDSTNGFWSDILVSSYATGMNIHDSSRFTLTNYIAHTKSPNGTTASGHNSLVLQSPRYAKLSNLQLADAGEHCIYHDTTVDLDSFEVSYTNVQLFRCGQSGFKLSGNLSGSARAKHITITGLEAVDMSTGNSAGATEHALMIEQSDFITVSGFSTFKDADADHAFNCIYLRDVTNVVIPSPFLQNCKDSAIFITDAGLAETAQNVFITSPLIQSPGADCVEFDYDTVSSEVRNIVITDMWCGSPGGYAANLNILGNNILQAVTIEGRVRNATTGIVNNVTGTTDEDLTIRLSESEDREIVSGTVNLSVYLEYSVLNANAGAVTATLPDGVVAGQMKIISANGTNSSTVSVTNHETSDPEVFTFNAATDVLILQWTGAEWYTLKNIGVTTDVFEMQRFLDFMEPANDSFYELAA